MKEAIIIAGGRGTRLMNITNGDIPKCLARIGDRTILQIQIDNLLEVGFDKIVISISQEFYETVEQYVWDTWNGRETKESHKIIVQADTIENMGTGGALNLCLKHCETEYILVMYSDVLITMYHLKLASMFEEHIYKNAIVTSLITDYESQYGVFTDMNNRGKDLIFKEKPRIPGRYINCGVYCISRTPIKHLLDGWEKSQNPFPYAFEKAIVEPSYIKSRGATVETGNHGWITIETNKEYLKAQTLDWWEFKSNKEKEEYDKQFKQN